MIILLHKEIAMFDGEPEVTAGKIKYKILGREAKDTALQHSEVDEISQSGQSPRRIMQVPELKFFSKPPFVGIGDLIRAETRKLRAEILERKMRAEIYRSERPHIRLVK